MTRFASSSMQAQADQSLTAFRMLFDIGITSGTIYATTGRQWLLHAGNTYCPVGYLGEVSPIGEETDAFPRDITLRLCGINTIAATGSFSVYEPLREDMFNRPVSIRRTFLDVSSGFAQVASAELMWKGKITAVNVMLEEGVYETRCESALRKTAASAYFNRETLTAIDSSDTFGNHVEHIPLFRSDWGGAPTYFNGGPPASRGGGSVMGQIGDAIRRGNYPTGG